MYRTETTLTWFALALAAVYLGISGAFKKRFPGQDTKFIHLLHVAIAIAFITIAIPLKLEAQWITIGWLVESAVLLWMSVKTQTDFLRYLAVAALTLGLSGSYSSIIFMRRRWCSTRGLPPMPWPLQSWRGLQYSASRHASDEEMVFIRLAVVGVNLLALIALTLEASDYFNDNFHPT